MLVLDLNEPDYNGMLCSPEGSVFWLEFPDARSRDVFSSRLQTVARRLRADYEAQSYHALGLQEHDVCLLRRVEVVTSGTPPRKYTRRDKCHAS